MVRQRPLEKFFVKRPDRSDVSEPLSSEG